MRFLLTWLCLVLGPFLPAACPLPPRPTVVSAVLARDLGPLPGTRSGFVELRPGQGLDRLLPTRTIRRLGGLADLPSVHHGERRIAVVLAGCAETSTPRVVLRDDRVQVGFSRPSAARCFVAEHTVAVFDLSPSLARRVLAAVPTYA